MLPLLLPVSILLAPVNSPSPLYVVCFPAVILGLLRWVASLAWRLSKLGPLRELAAALNTRLAGAGVLHRGTKIP
jgi:hypothetical protein